MNNINIGDKVEHIIWGIGIVTYVSGIHLKLKLDENKKEIKTTIGCLIY